MKTIPRRSLSPNSGRVLDEDRAGAIGLDRVCPRQVLGDMAVDGASDEPMRVFHIPLAIEFDRASCRGWKWGVVELYGVGSFHGPTGRAAESATNGARPGAEHEIHLSRWGHVPINLTARILHERLAANGRGHRGEEIPRRHVRLVRRYELQCDGECADLGCPGSTGSVTAHRDCAVRRGGGAKGKYRNTSLRARCASQSDRHGHLGAPSHQGLQTSRLGAPSLQALVGRLMGRAPIEESGVRTAADTTQATVRSGSHPLP